MGTGLSHALAKQLRLPGKPSKELGTLCPPDIRRVLRFELDLQSGLLFRAPKLLAQSFAGFLQQPSRTIRLR